MAKSDPDPPTVLELVERLHAAHLTQESIAHVLGMAYRTVKRRLAEDPEWKAAAARGEELELLDLKVMYFKACARGGGAPLIFAMKNLHGWKDKREIEVTDLRKPLAELMGMSVEELEAEAGEAHRVEDDDEEPTH